MNALTAGRVVAAIREADPDVLVTFYSDGSNYVVVVDEPQSGIIPPPFFGEVGVRLAYVGEAPETYHADAPPSGRSTDG